MSIVESTANSRITHATFVLGFNKMGCDILSSDSLTELACKIRNDVDLPLCIRASLVHRGLPVVNVTK